MRTCAPHNLTNQVLYATCIIFSTCNLIKRCEFDMPVVVDTKDRHTRTSRNQLGIIRERKYSARQLTAARPSNHGHKDCEANEFRAFASALERPSVKEGHRYSIKTFTLRLKFTTSGRTRGFSHQGQLWGCKISVGDRQLYKRVIQYSVSAGQPGMPKMW